MPLCGTLHYAGAVPDTKAERESGKWRLKDQSGAIQDTDWKFGKRDELFDNRLVGLRPTLRVMRCQLIIEAAESPEWIATRGTLGLGTARVKEPVKRAAAHAVTLFTGFETFNHNPLGLTPQALF
jgi:hypothetical protein